MARQSFYGDNTRRSYPFVQDVDLVVAVASSDGGSEGSGPVVLPDSAVADFGSVVGLDARFGGDSEVYLHSASLSGTTLTFDFRSVAPGLSGWRLAFECATTDPEFSVYEAEASSVAHPDTDPGACGDHFLWDGFMVTGDLSEVAAMLGEGGVLTAADSLILVEPALTQDLGLGYVRSVNLANHNRTHATFPDGCSSEGDSAYGENDYVVNQVCMDGNITLIEGYNCSIRQNADDGSFTVSAAVAAGAGRPCDEVPLYTDEPTPSGSGLLTGGPSCDEVLKSVNGVSAVVVKLLAGAGVTIGPDLSSPNTIVVDVDFHDLTLTPAAASSDGG